jgi:hypothetical protein
LTSRKKNTTLTLMEESSLTPEKLRKILKKAKIPKEIQERIISELPEVIEQIDDAVKQIYDPNTIWLEAIQFADYVHQFAKHLQENHGEECLEEIAVNLVSLAQEFKYMGEGALRVIDESEEMDGTQF